MGFIPARCIICTSAFHSGNIACLPCGHTFHHACARQWIQQAKSCPHCRCRVIESNIIKQIYFDLVENDDHGKTSAEEYAQKCEELSIELEKEKGSKYEMKQQLIENQKKCDSLNDLLEREKKKVERKIPQLESRNRELEMMARDFTFVQNELTKMEKRVKASQFYELLIKGSVSDAEAAIDKYINNKGDPASGSFITLMKRQLEESRNSNAKLQHSVRRYEKELDIKNKKIIHLKNLLTALKTEAEELRSSTNRSTPYNSKLRRVFEITPPEKRVSLGFNQSIDFPDEIIDSAFKSKPVNGKIRNLNEENEDSLNADYQGVMDNVLPFPSLDDTLNESADLDLPKNVLDRIYAGSPQKKTNPFGIVPKGAQRSLEILKNKKTVEMAPRPIKKAVKRKFEPLTNPSGNSKPFFRNLSNSKLKPDYITL